jgi:photosystem II stability/assembly factor-like uncharacterized protein
VGSNQAPVILATTDGGHRWGTQAFPVAPGLSKLGEVEAVDCPTITTCWAIAGMGSEETTPVIVATVDGGKRWSLQSFPDDDMVSEYGGFFGLSCPTVRDCEVVGYAQQDNDGPSSVVLATSDGGRKWVAQTLPSTTELATGYLTAVSCPSATTCFATGVVGSDSYVTSPVTVVTTDGGDVWTALPSLSMPARFDGLVCVKTTRCWEAGGYVSNSDNSGSTGPLILRSS